MKASSVRKTDVQQRIETLVEEYRDRCLWFLRRDYVPETTEEVLQVLDLIERYGDRSGFLRAEEIRSSLSQQSSRQS